jgi:uridine kinase
MLADQEPNEKMMDSNEFAEPVLAKDFELSEGGVNTARAVGYLAEAITELPLDSVRIVSLIGGAASGKSTLRQALIYELKKTGLSTDYIATDDFNKGDRAWRWENFEWKEDVDATGKYDFELMNAKLRAIKQNTDPTKTVAVPTYDQATGLAIDAGEENYTHKVGRVDVLIVEGDFHKVNDPDLVIYLHVPDEQRLQNRVTRDVVHRGGDQEKTTASFNFRQRSQHVPHTLPNIEKANIVLDVNAKGDEWSFDIYKAKQRNGD